MLLILFHQQPAAGAPGFINTDLTVTVTDATGAPLDGATVVLTADSPNVYMWPVTPQGNGHYAAQIGSTVAGAYQITATVGSVYDTDTLTIEAGADFPAMLLQLHAGRAVPPAIARTVESSGSSRATSPTTCESCGTLGSYSPQSMGRAGSTPP